MKKLIYLFAVAGLLSTAAVAQTPPPPAHPGMPMTKPGEKYPNIHDAMKALEDAKAHLNKAPDIFGGHRVDAIAKVDAALAELKEAIKYADTHPHK